MGSIIRRNVAFEEVDMEIVQDVQHKRGLGKRGFSAALRMIIRAWAGKDDEERVHITEAGREAINENDR